LGARLSVQLSAVRRVLRGGVVADRSSIRLDLDEVDVDVEAWLALDTDDDIVDAYRGDLLPDDRYEDFTGPLREEMRARMTAAAMNVVGRADDPSRQAEVARRVLTVDRFHEAAHHALTRALEEKGSFGAATAAYDDYVAAMHELGAEPASRQSLR
jgi:DNA-binding SARP family transcriptional activator